MMVLGDTLVSCVERIAWKAIIFPLQSVKRMLSNYIFFKIIQININQHDDDDDNTKNV